MKRITLLLCLFFVAACGEPDPKPASNNLNNQNSQNAQPECTVTADCDVSEACVDFSCVATCTTDADCAAGEACTFDEPSESLVCKPQEVNLNNINNTNNLNNTNNAGAFLYFMVEDTTFGDGCGTSDPGSDFQYVEIQDTVGSTVGYGEAIWLEFGSGENDYVDTAILDGNPPGFAGECTDFTDTSIVSLGCDGRLIVRAVDGTGTPFEVESGVNQIVFGEFGIQCGGSMDDSYNVWGCTDPQTAANGIFDSCSVLWGENLSGLVTLGPLAP